MNPPRGRSLNSKWVSYPALIEVILADTIDKEGEDRFCHFVEKMPPVSYCNPNDGAQADPQKPEGMVRLFDRGVRSIPKRKLMTGLLLCPRI
jgi:hypothetical protein